MNDDPDGYERLMEYREEGDVEEKRLKAEFEPIIKARKEQAE